MPAPMIVANCEHISAMDFVLILPVPTSFLRKSGVSRTTVSLETM